MMKALELKVPPLLLLLICVALLWLVAHATPSFAFPLPWRGTISTLLVVAGALVAIAGVAAFRRSRTTVDPTCPEATSAVVTSGIYRWTRNPMYLGFLLALAGWAAFLAHWAGLIALPLFVAYLSRFQIDPEERALEAQFGHEFSEYMKAVRRWI